MDIKKLLITDECSQTIPDSLRAAGLTVDHAGDITPQKLVEVVSVRSCSNQVPEPSDIL